MNVSKLLTGPVYGKDIAVLYPASLLFMPRIAAVYINYLIVCVHMRVPVFLMRFWLKCLCRHNLHRYTKVYSI